MSAPATLDRDRFWTHLQVSGLIPPAERDAARAAYERAASGRDLADALVGAGLLTPFQAQRLLSGRSNGFFLGPYRVLDLIGRGGTGRVFRARHEGLGRVVALKVLSAEMSRSDRAKQNFEREIRATADLAHPNIVVAYDAGCADGRYYLATEYVPGPTLQAYVNGRGPMPLGRAAEAVKQVAAGLAFAHGRGVVHRDVKPANVILLPRSGVPGQTDFIAKLLDFGLARITDPADGLSTRDSIVTGPNGLAGTPDFMSPEQARSVHHADDRSDIYSLGAVWYFLLTGHVPYPGGTPVDKLLRLSTEPPAEPLVALRPNVPLVVAQTVERMMARDPEDRFPNAVALLEALRSLPAEQPSGRSSGNLMRYVQRLSPEPPGSPGAETTRGRGGMTASPWDGIDLGDTIPTSQVFRVGDPEPTVQRPAAPPTLRMALPQPPHWWRPLTVPAALLAAAALLTAGLVAVARYLG